KSKGKADLIVFPELAVGGYLVGDRMNNQSNIDELMAYNDRIRSPLKMNGSKLWSPGSKYLLSSKIP
ncbi:hypothetical protein PT043_08975, partial [Erysipelothrix rhusiopathiae]|nr:hypothetical protein [Erysipelothrix rhusiopathiae]